MARNRRPQKPLPLVAGCLLLLVAVLLGWQPLSEQLSGQPVDGELQVHFIDVGQADAALLCCEGSTMLIDGGNAADSDLIYTYLKNNQITHLDYIVCTHAHEDHVGGLAGALQYATAEVALCPVTSYESRAFESFCKYLDQQGVEITVPSPGDRFALGGAQVTALGPLSDSDETNNTSIVLRVVYGETAFLFTGDAEQAEEEEILAAGYALRSTVLKVGHHGSSSSSSWDFLQAVAPAYAVISVGEGNSYGHPSQEVLDRLQAMGTAVYRTDESGDILCTSDGQAVTFRTQKSR